LLCKAGDNGDLVPNAEVEINQQLEHVNQLTQLPNTGNFDNC